MLLCLIVQLPISFPVLLCLVLNSSYGLKWHFNPPLSPWWGGIFERMVGSVERCLEKILLSERIAFEDLETVLREIELTLNNRALTFTYEIRDELLNPAI